jgi:hypothetical protein
VSKEKVVNPMDLPWYSITWRYVKLLLISLAVFAFLRLFWGDYMLVNLHRLAGRGLVAAGLAQVWPIFAWALAVPLMATFVFKQKRPLEFDSRSVQIVKGLWLSLHAGVFEELIYRWLAFANAMVMLSAFNWITHGFVKWFYMQLLVPLANFSTLHALQPYLLHEGGWIFGAAIVSAAAEFRAQHRYLGILGWVNSWFMGMVFFYLVLNYGLLTAIAAHFLYDTIIFTFRGLTSRS